MNLVTDAVAGTREPHAELGRGGLKESVIVRVLETRLQCVVVHIAHRQLSLDPRHVHSLEFEVRHGTCGVLGESLIDPDGDLLSGRHAAFREMRGYDLPRNTAATHTFSSYPRAARYSSRAALKC